MKIYRYWQRFKRGSHRILVRIGILKPRSRLSSDEDPPNETDKEYIIRLRNLIAEPAPKNPGWEFPKSALHFKKELTPYEQNEIQEYELVYTAGSRNAKFGTCHSLQQFTTNEGRYRVRKNDHIDYRYVVEKKIGEGSYAEVFKCIDTRNEKSVAVKIMKRPISNLYKEAATLLRIHKHGKGDQSHAVELLDYEHFRKHLFIVMSLYDTDFTHYLAMKPRQETIHYIMQLRSVLHGLEFLRRHEIVHGDLKPSNILLNLNDKFNLKLADFGLSATSNQPVGTNVFQTVNFRAPEVFLELQVTSAIDMWSFGVIVARVVNGNHFLNEYTAAKQFALLLDYFGMPPKEMMAKIRHPNKFFTYGGHPKYCTAIQDENGEVTYETHPHDTAAIGRQPPGVESRLGEFFQGKENARILDFLNKCFTWKWESRIHPAFALKHPIFYAGQ
ncbi:hypothetical protein L3Y34_012318 [Caenorhabditis briggsae]|uniref:Protein kinase domain-containing protein n=1 Tax=Caenorhabditis briggsae TaxID=6238 RepID=A0AAE8ZNW0_CAEBR|nr:hypothetical protein L3Y34_012318 [Caenorhabditis briggsae]